MAKKNIKIFSGLKKLGDKWKLMPAKIKGRIIKGTAGIALVSVLGTGVVMSLNDKVDTPYIPQDSIVQEDDTYEEEEELIIEESTLEDTEEETVEESTEEVTEEEEEKTDETTTQEPTTENPTTEQDGAYRAPDGSYWSSEQEYLYYINGPTV